MQFDGVFIINQLKKKFQPMLRGTFLALFFVLFTGCTKDAPEVPKPCPDNQELINLSSRNFQMGFTSWPYGPELNDVETTYDFIHSHGDIYAEHIDDHIPWSAWMNGTKLPDAFTENIAFRLSKKPANQPLLLSVSILNNSRDDLAEDFNGNTPHYAHINHRDIENAYVKHLEYLVEQFQPDYLVLGIEVNEMWINANPKWPGFKNLMLNIQFRIKQTYPDLMVSQSVTLHNWYEPGFYGAEDYIEEITELVNGFDFAAISFYPFLKGLHHEDEFQRALDFVHNRVHKPIAFVETAHNAADISLPSLNLFIQGSPCEQKAYLEILLLNAHKNQYEFIIWWAHRDFDALLSSFPPELVDLGKIWRDTGLLDENGNARPAFEVWANIMED